MLINKVGSRRTSLTGLSAFSKREHNNKISESMSNFIIYIYRSWKVKFAFSINSIVVNERYILHWNQIFDR
jgi:hypothetical protein